MTLGKFTVRRATLDDIDALTALWRSMHWATDELAKRITEFQVAESAETGLVGAIAMQMLNRQGRVHSEAFTDFGMAEQARAQLWDRLQSVATNNGLHRLWTQEQAPFWSRCGLTKADPESLEKLPEAWRGFQGQWLTLKLKEDIEEVLSADREFALFMQSERARTERAFQQAKILKAIAMLLAVGVLFLVIGGAFLVIRRNPHLLHR